MDLFFHRPDQTPQYAPAINRKAVLANTPLSAEAAKGFDFAPPKKWLKERLPSYMLPDFFVEVAHFELTGNGKIDRRALPHPLRRSDSAYEPGRNELERALCDIWAKVLGLPRVGINDNYFTLGGNSILAVRLSGACRNQLGRALGIAELFEHQTIARLAPHLSGELATITPAPEGARPLSFAQERLFFIQQFEQGTDAYHNPLLMKLDPSANMARLHWALDELVSRHNVLSSVFVKNDAGEYCQQVDHQIPVWHQRQVADDAELDAAVRTDIAQAFDLTKEPPLKRYHYNLPDGDQYWLLVFHHVAFDGWSLEIILNELGKLYQGQSLTPLEVSYADYAHWQRQYLQTAVMVPLKAYWQQQLAGFEPLNLPTDYPRPAHFDYRGQTLVFELPESLSVALRDLARRECTSLYTLLLGGFATTLAMLSGQRDIVIGSPSENRPHSQTQGLVGFFVNSLVLRSRIEPEQSVQALLKQLHQSVQDAKKHQEMPFEQLLNELGLPRDPSRHPLFQVMFSLQSFAEAPNAYAALPFTPVHDDTLYTPAKFDISLLMTDAGQAIRGELNFATALFSADTMAALAKYFERALHAFVVAPEASLGKIDWLNDAERQQIAQWGMGDKIACEGTLQQRFAEQVEKTPDNIAVVCGDARLTYQALEARVDRIAAAILADGVAAGQIVGLYFERGVDMVASLLAVLKVGAAYLPISPQLPVSRVRFMLEDTNTGLVLCNEVHLEALDSCVSPLAHSPVLQAVDDLPERGPVSVRGEAEDLAYLIYTSGTTGQPKGVMVEQRNVINLIDGQRQAFDFEEDEQVLWLASYAFDASVEQLFLALLGGATLHIPDDELILSAPAMRAYLQAHKITHLHATPGYLMTLGEFGSDHALRRVISGGDRCPAKLHQWWGDKLINEYGPTEATVTAVQQLAHDGSEVIGKPLAGVEVRVLTDGGTMAPVGAVGQLYIGGAGVARGYWNRVELTAKRFVDGFYQTGDLVRFLPSGVLAFLWSSRSPA